MPKREYHKEDIKAMIHKRGATLRQIGLNAGLCIDAGSNCLHRPVPSANQAISDFLGIPLHELWPRWFDQNGNRVSRRNQHKRSVARHLARVESRVESRHGVPSKFS